MNQQTVEGLFLEALEAFLWWEMGEPEPLVEFEGKKILISKVCWMALNCTDTMARSDWQDFIDALPCCERDIIEQKSPHTYAVAARTLKHQIMQELKTDAQDTPR